MRRTVVTRAAAMAVALAGLASLTGCSGAKPLSGSAAGQSVPAVSAAPSAAAVQVRFSPTTGATDVRMDAPVQVSLEEGVLRKVTVTAEDGDVLEGELDQAGRSWRSSAPLAKGTDYTISAEVAAPDGRQSTASSKFTTLTPDRTVGATILPGDNWVVGVGMPIVVDFTRAVSNRRAAEKAITVTSTPKVEGAWRWLSSSQVQWRPESFWPAGAKVDVSAELAPVELAEGAWGRRTVKSSFRIGSSMISTVDVAKHTMTVRQDGKVLRVLPITTGKVGFLTRNGTKVIMSRQEKVRMDAATTGTDPKDPNYYNLEVHWAMRLTWSGEFLHAAPWSVASQGKDNVSHGCTGMSDANAEWLFKQSKVGDVVIYKNSPRPLDWGNGYTAWNKSFADWSSGA